MNKERFLPPGVSQRAGETNGRRFASTAFSCALVVALLSRWCSADVLLPTGGTMLDPSATFSASYGISPDGGFGPTVGEPVADATTTVGGYTFDVNALVGATRYYDHTTPIIGQNTITTNLEAGFFWNGHETLAHVVTDGTNFIADAESWGGASVSAKYDRHATWAAMLIGGRQTLGGGIYQDGIAFGTNLRSAAIASEWISPAYALSFDFTVNSFLTPYQQTFGVADVVNSSYGFTDPNGTNAFSVVMDAYSFQNPKTTYVVSAGNSGPGSNTIGSPGADYNAITVAALGNANAFNTVAGFSSRAPQDFGYLAGSGTTTVVGVRSAVDIAAPGESLVSAFYGGQNGGNNTSLANSIDSGTTSDVYTLDIAGTSFAAPIVAGGAALVASAAKTLPALSGNPDATQSLVVKALLLNGADKTTGWSNGQATVTIGGTTYISTVQSVDSAVGTGRMNLDKTFDMQVNGQTDVSGMATGLLGNVLKSGWDYGNAILGANNDYVIADWLAGGTTLTTTLSWMRNRFFNYATTQYADVAQADLDLSVWALDGSNTFTSLIARSESLYNTVEHLSFVLPASGHYGLRVSYSSNSFDNSDGDVWGSASFPQDYGLAWTAVPEPATVVLLAAGIVFGLTVRSRHRGPPPAPSPDDTA